MQITLKERIESIQVGSISALAFLVPYLLFLIVDRLLLGESLTLIGAFVKISGAIISGFLFGVTYRYVVRNDDNPHLKDGTVAAFALVRGLVPLQLSTKFALQQQVQFQIRWLVLMVKPLWKVQEQHLHHGLQV